MDFNKIQNQFASIEQVRDQYLNSNKKAGVSNLNKNGLSFEEVLSSRTRELTEVKFSKHAENRLSERNINLSPEQMKRLNEGTYKASTKGINESLVMVDSLAFIVNTKNNTVITAMDSLDSEENVYTNIDGAVIM
ncbi:MAG: flagellar protein [Lachnospiraceae bacterium]|nr:flagellar protein [Lachnospiraceae bacterium]